MDLFEQVLEAHPHAAEVTDLVLNCRADGHPWKTDEAAWFVEPDISTHMPPLARKDIHCGGCGTIKTRWMVIRTNRDWGPPRYTYPEGFLQVGYGEDRASREDYRGVQMNRDLAKTTRGKRTPAKGKQALKKTG